MRGSPKSSRRPSPPSLRSIGGPVSRSGSLDSLTRRLEPSSDRCSIRLQYPSRSQPWQPPCRSCPPPQPALALLFRSWGGPDMRPSPGTPPPKHQSSVRNGLEARGILAPKRRGGPGPPGQHVLTPRECASDSFRGLSCNQASGYAIQRDGHDGAVEPSSGQEYRRGPCLAVESLSNRRVSLSCTARAPRFGPVCGLQLHPPPLDGT